MSVTASAVAPASAGLVHERARALVGHGTHKVLLLRAAPVWTGPDVIEVDGCRVRVRPGPSQLAVLAEILDLPEEECLVVLTDRPEQDLGDAVMLRALGRRIEQPDDWSALADMVGAQAIDPALRRQGRWAAATLLENQPREGWPVATTGVLTQDAALGNLLAHLLGERVPAHLDAVRLLELLNRSDRRARWAAVDPDLRRHLTRWAGEALGPQSALALTAAAESTVSVVAVGLVADVLWPATPARTMDADQISARTRIEKYLGGRPVDQRHARALASDARDVALRLDDADDPELNNALVQAEALLMDLGWPDGRARSDVLSSGLTARLEAFGTMLDVRLTSQGADGDVEGAMAAIAGHRLAHRDPHEVATARMATRLVRWVGGPTVSAQPATLGESLHLHVDDGGWVDRAVAAVWTGSANAALAAVYRRLAMHAREVRAGRDVLAAGQLAAATARDEAPAGVVLVENLLAEVVRPLGAQSPVLLIVLDGMSMRVATEVAQGALDIGWSELVPKDGNTRAVALATLPTVTRFSRTSLLTGRLRDGGQSTEKPRFRALTGGPLFHKDDLRADSGALLAADVGAAIDDEATRVVGVVLNTIDDALAKDDPEGTRWSLDRIQHLRPLLDRAILAGRVVVLTSDHGHVVERGSEGRAVAGADSRWRPTSTGPAAGGEVEVSGSRVLAAGGAAVLALDEDLRYGAKSAGYHGGASLAEITVPVVVLDRIGRASIASWKEAPPQVPAWWHDPAVTPRPESPAERSLSTATKRAPKPPQPGQGTLDIFLPEPAVPAAPAEAGLVDRLLASPTYRTQRSRAGRRPVDEGVLRAVLDELLNRSGRAHRDTVANAAGVSRAALDPTLAAIKRILNLDGYPVVADEADGLTVALDERLLREQFELGG
ncbi:BREX-2 system phosphatase PglZ [Georgenia subflava]|uniref:BREX-2 system phosphatase PglZ n=1 Tax=Georgenia subflava TaxID=1622177 RepID=UPI00128C55C0|nr:BREX-2 system phosphatase PglZ [Georgenia subflava]